LFAEPLEGTKDFHRRSIHIRVIIAVISFFTYSHRPLCAVTTSPWCSVYN